MSEFPAPELVDASPDIEVLPMEETEASSTDNVRKPPQRVFKVNFSFANDPKVQARKRKLPSPSPPRVQTQITDFKTASGRRVDKGQMKSIYGPQPSSSRVDDGPAGQENGVGARYLGGTRRGGNATVTAPFRAPIARREQQEDYGDGAGASALVKASECLGGLKSEKSLKNFDPHIVDMIESEIMSLSTTIDWNDVAGLVPAKKTLKEIVVLPFMRPDLCKGIRAPPKGVLLFGPPGTGKTMIGRCVASQCAATFFNISASSLTSKWVGEGEKLVRALFAVARLKLPSIIFIDEIDSLLSSRSESEHESSRRIKTEFLVQLDGLSTSSEERLLVLGATNRPQELDEAARRRFAKRLYIALPDQTARIDIIKRLLSDHANTITEEEFVVIGQRTEGYSGADMRELCIEAAKEPMRELGEAIMTVKAEEIRPIGLIDFNAALRVVRPTVIEADLTTYREWDREFGCLPPPV